MKRILVTGANGQLGKCIQDVAQGRAEFLFADIEELDITEESAVNNYFHTHDIGAVINCAAYTAVDQAESDAENCAKVNTLAPALLAQAARKSNARMIHVSTDYVFDGSGHQPYGEDGKTNPQSVYGKTKNEGEQLVNTNNPNSIIIRTSWLYSEYGNNFVKTITRLGTERESLNIIFDQIGTPTYAQDLAESMVLLVDQEEGDFKSGTYHYSNEGVASWYDFAQAILEIQHVECKLFPVKSSEFVTAAPRPFYSVMDKSKIKTNFDLVIPYWRDSLVRCLACINKVK